MFRWPVPEGEGLKPRVAAICWGRPGARAWSQVASSHCRGPARLRRVRGGAVAGAGWVASTPSLSFLTTAESGGGAGSGSVLPRSVGVD